MKRFALKTLATTGHIGMSYVAGYAFGKVLSALFSPVLTEETYESKPVLFWGCFVLYMILLVGFPVVYAFVWPANKIYNKVLSKIDDLADEKEWD